ncbi:10913_t:CDS:2 [Acaulospora morrowiae]|uniref:Elongation of fatty acids protein n=1 Tax=Acaulospora morrowiae TaxID=94023 RepID=A0A9N9EDA4_9GLOM|nr:10913_t:CDS:2 [Acaulospora morrowiae]
MEDVKPSSVHFSLDRPFGIYAYDYFTQVYTYLTGKDPNEFRFIQGVTPLSTLPEVLIGCVTYLSLIFGGQLLLANAPVIKAKFLFQVHNLLLTIFSATLLVLFVEQLLPIYWRNGIFYAVCSRDAWTQRLEFLYYLNYLVKWWELIDTIFLVLKKKNLEFLHVYHHSMTMALCYSQLRGRTTVSWVPITLNLVVHVFMYYYYFRTAGGARIWWKKYLTTLQIVQFMIDLVFVYFCSYTYFTSTYWPWIPNFGSCAGEESAAIFGCSLLSSYLLLFIGFYKKTYNVKGAVPPKNKSSTKAE